MYFTTDMCMNPLAAKVMKFRCTTSIKIPSIIKNMKLKTEAWTSICTLQAKTKEKLLKYVEHILFICTGKNLRLSAKLCSIYTTSEK